MRDNIARGLGSLMREAEVALEADAATAPTQVTRATRSRRRRSRAAFGAVAAVACVGLGIAGFGFVKGSPEPSLVFTPSPSASATEDLTIPLATAVIPIDGGPEYDGFGAMLDCGAAAPPPSGTLAHFGISIDAAPKMIDLDSPDTGRGKPVPAQITYDSSNALPVEQTPVTLMLVKDGKVAGFFVSDDGSPQFWTYSDFEANESTPRVGRDGMFCPDVSTSGTDEIGYGELKPGEYQVIPVARVWASEEAAALRHLNDSGIRVNEFPSDQRPAGFPPGSWDCKQAVAQYMSPRSCLGDATGSAIVDVDAGTVSLPYDPEDFTEPLNITLVGDPIALTVTGDPDSSVRDLMEANPLDVSDPIECGTTFDFTTPAAPITLSGRIPYTIGMDKNAFTSTNVSVLPTTQGAGELTLDHDAKAWLVTYTPVNREGSDSYLTSVITGAADVTIAGSNTVPYDRFTGPTTVDLVFSNVSACDDIVDVGVGIIGVVIDGSVTMTLKGDTPGESVASLLYLDQLSAP
ncbi:hypothetical protein [Demequina oxidasica]|uniref:hypothetical protein n=1 Tax=Demequina oxidasica TaxID=676199 RepID=UPI000781831D|nr:hypothetical protein [Demequina oxidasica]